MPNKINTFIFLIFSVFCFNSIIAQTETAKPDEDEFAAKKVETKLTEVIETDSMPPGELTKRAINWIKQESIKYKKTGGTTNGNKIECVASFPVKPKDLNPQVDYTGKITMKVVIDCKDDKYRYIVSEIKHISKNGTTTAGSIDNKVPECGSMAMSDIIWKKLKGEALTGASQVVTDIKAAMLLESIQPAKEEW